MVVRCAGHSLAEAPSPGAAATEGALDLQHAYLAEDGASHVLVVPSASDVGVNVIVNIDNIEASSVQARSLVRERWLNTVQHGACQDICTDSIRIMSLLCVGSSYPDYTRLQPCMTNHACLGSKCMALPVISNIAIQCLIAQCIVSIAMRLVLDLIMQAPALPPATGLAEALQSKSKLPPALAPKHAEVPSVTDGAPGHAASTSVSHVHTTTPLHAPKEAPAPAPAPHASSGHTAGDSTAKCANSFFLLSERDCVLHERLLIAVLLCGCPFSQPARPIRQHRCTQK